MTLADPRAVLLFARAPQREQKHLGLGVAERTRVHRALLRHVVRVTSALDPSVSLVVAHDGLDPREAATLTTLAGPRAVVFTAQRGASFDARLGAAIDDAMALGFTRLALVGSDTPGLATADLARALEGGLVAGPSLDGGFYLLGFDVSTRGIVARLPWRTRHVFAALVARARSLGLELVSLARRGDLDDAADLVRLAVLVEVLILAASLGPVALVRRAATFVERHTPRSGGRHVRPPLRGPPSAAR